MRPVIPHHIPRIPSTVNDWVAEYPNPADFPFDYYKLLDLAKTNNNAIGKAPTSGLTVAIVGAGAAGMTAARELYRCGYRVWIFEASNRVCGRHYTVHTPGQKTGMELGAMRFPFFSEPGSRNALFDYYLHAEANATTAPFPNPGAAPGNTGIFVNQGYGPNNEFYPNKKLIFWPQNDVPTPPNDAALTGVYNQVHEFISFFTHNVGQRYATSTWTSDWEKIANCYDKMSISDLVFAPAVTTYANDGWAALE